MLACIFKVVSVFDDVCAFELVSVFDDFCVFEVVSVFDFFSPVFDLDLACLPPLFT